MPACLRACVPACLRACVPACVRACVRACVCVCVCQSQGRPCETGRKEYPVLEAHTLAARLFFGSPPMLQNPMQLIPVAQARDAARLFRSFLVETSCIRWRRIVKLGVPWGGRHNEFQEPCADAATFHEMAGGQSIVPTVEGQAPLHKQVPKK